MYTLYGKKGSGSASTEAALEIVGAPCRIIETASWEQNEAFAELLKVNPLGQIPTLVLPDGSALSESAAILIHLGSAHSEVRLLPRELSAGRWITCRVRTPSVRDSGRRPRFPCTWW